MTPRYDFPRKMQSQDSRQTPRRGFVKRPLKVLLAAIVFLFFGIFRLRSITWFTYDMWGMYQSYLSGYLGGAVLSGVINFTQLGYVTVQPWLNAWQNLSNGSMFSFDSFTTTWYLISGIEIVIAAIAILAAYSTLMLRRSWIAKIGAVTLIIAGILDVASPYPLIESILGIAAIFVLLRPDVRDAYTLKEGRTTPPARGGLEEEVTFKADLETPKEKRRTGRKCPKCGLLLPPSAKVCRRCGTRLLE
ncbi:MAG: zinc ribbon domain-containing protein [Promethearchaeati archaeon SRVP18_Atabeyarchaeia-1]